MTELACLGNPLYQKIIPAADIRLWCVVVSRTLLPLWLFTSLVPRPYFFVKENRQNEAAKKEMGVQFKKKFGKSCDPQGFLWTWAICSPQSWRKVFSHAFRVIRLYCSVQCTPPIKLLQVREPASGADPVGGFGGSSTPLASRIPTLVLWVSDLMTSLPEG